MPYYAGLKQIKDAAVRQRTIAGLQRLRPALTGAIPPRTATDTLLLGQESAGVPEEVHDISDLRLRIPLLPGMRSINVALATAMVLTEALRQTKGFPAS